MKKPDSAELHSVPTKKISRFTRDFLFYIFE